MKKMNKDTRRLLIIVAVIAVIAVIYFAGGSSAPAADPQTPPPAALSTLPPTEAPKRPETPAETEAPAAPEIPAETEVPEETEAPAYPEDISYTDGETDDIDEYGTYSGAEDVAYYLHAYGHLPDNYITKAEAEDAGWVSTKGNLWDVAYGASIGGDRFGNREGLLPKGEKYYECDVNYTGGYRGEERLIFTDDGDVYYTADHYRSFEKLY